jgi:hypothetical protein
VRAIEAGSPQQRFGTTNARGEFNEVWFLERFVSAFVELECMEDYVAQGTSTELQDQSAEVRKSVRQSNTRRLVADIRDVTNFVHWKAARAARAARTARAAEYMDFLRFFGMMVIEEAHKATERKERKTHSARQAPAAPAKETMTMVRNLRKVIERADAETNAAPRRGARMARERAFERIVWLLSQHADGALTAQDKRDRFERWVRTLTANAQQSLGDDDDDEEDENAKYARFLELDRTRAGLVGGTYAEFLDTLELKRSAVDTAWVRQHEIEWLEAARIDAARIAQIVRARDAMVRRYVLLGIGDVDENADENASHLAARRDATGAGIATARERATARAYAVMRAPVEPAGLAMRDVAALRLTAAERDKLAAFADAGNVLDAESWRFASGKQRARVCASMRAELEANENDDEWPFPATLRASVDRICRSWAAIRRELRHGKREGARRLRLTNGDDPTKLAAVAKLHADNLEYRYRRLKEKGIYSERQEDARRERSERALRRDDAKRREADFEAIRSKYGPHVGSVMRGTLLRHDAEKRRPRTPPMAPPSARRARRRIPESPDE